MSDTVRVAGINMELLSSTETFPNEGRVACQGVKGAYSQQAANRMFAKSMPMFFKTFSGVIEAVKSGMVDYGILPIENNSYGSVRATYQLLKNAGVYIIRAERILIRHQLLVKPGTNLADVTSIRSHEQALGQCSHFLKKMEDQAAIIPVLNTAMAARYVSESEDKGAAAIASPEAAEIYGLQALSTRVSDSDNNYTRFVCISKEPKIYPGSLYNIIGKFAKRGINITKLESSPIVGRNFEFRFYIDADASCADPDVRIMLDELRNECPEFVFLGNYSEA